MMKPRVAIISDTVDDINGVAIGLRRLVAASTRAGHTMSLVGPPAKHGITDSVVRIPAAMSASLPIYPDYTWSVPELPAMVDYLTRNADLVQIATPGPMGLAGLIAGRMLKLPILAQYHTEIAQYATAMTGMPMLGALIDPLVGWVYKQADLCLAPSEAVAKRLAQLGVAADRLRRIPRGVDLELFHPSKRDRGVLAKYELGTGPVALYVGRLSKEKNMEGLLAAWTKVHATRPDARLLLVGDGPAAASHVGPGVVRTGALFGDDLARVFASCDAFAFASETETFGNVVIEAAASGLPSIVMPGGAAHEHVIDGATGMITADREAFASALGSLFDDAALRLRMSAAARAHAHGYDLDLAMQATWAIYDGLVVRPRRRDRIRRRLGLRPRGAIAMSRAS